MVVRAPILRGRGKSGRSLSQRQRVAWLIPKNSAAWAGRSDFVDCVCMAAVPIRPRCPPKTRRGSAEPITQLEHFPSDDSHQKRVKGRATSGSTRSPFLYVRAGNPAGYAKDYKTFRASRLASKPKIFLYINVLLYFFGWQYAAQSSISACLFWKRLPRA